MEDLLIFVLIVGLLAFVSVAVGMIAATRLDRIMNPEKKPQDPDAGPPAIEEHQP